MYIDGFQEKTGEGGGVRQSGKFPDYTGFFLLKASLIEVVEVVVVDDGVAVTGLTMEG